MVLEPCLEGMMDRQASTSIIDVGAEGVVVVNGGDDEVVVLSDRPRPDI